MFIYHEKKRKKKKLLFVIAYVNVCNSVLLQEQRDEFKPLLRLHKEDKASQVKLFFLFFFFCFWGSILVKSICILSGLDYPETYSSSFRVLSKSVLNRRQTDSEPFIHEEKSLQDTNRLVWEFDRPLVHWPGFWHV